MQNFVSELRLRGLLPKTFGKVLLSFNDYLIGGKDSGGIKTGYLIAG